MLRDDHSDYKWFFSTAGTIAENAVLGIIDWSAAFNVPNGLISDGPTHVKNENVRLVTKRLRVAHHFTLPYTPWSNKAVERLGKELVRTSRALVSELQMDFKEWPDLLPILQSALNNSPSPIRGSIAPITAFSGMESTPTILTFLRTSTVTSIKMKAAHRERVLNNAYLKARCAELHPIVNNALQQNRHSSRTRASRGELANFSIGDFVLVALEEFSAG